MKIITVEQLKKYFACESSLEFFKRNKSTDLEVQWNRFYKAERFDDLNWFLSNFLEWDNRIRYVVFAAQQAANIPTVNYPKDNPVEDAKLYFRQKVMGLESCADYETDTDCLTVANVGHASAETLRTRANDCDSPIVAATYHITANIFDSSAHAILAASHTVSDYAADYSIGYTAYNNACCAVSAAVTAAYGATFLTVAPITSDYSTIADAATAARNKMYKTILNYGYNIIKEQDENC